MTVLPRAANSGELTKLRSSNQASKLYLTVHAPITVYSAQLAAVPASNDSVTSITYNSGVGSVGAVLADQTVLVGTSPAASDLGMVRVRNLTGLGATSGTLNINETSEIQWASGAYLTFLDEFLLWRRDPRVLQDGLGTILMDWDIAYSDQHAHCLPVPVLGPHAVKWLRGANVTVAFDASNSWTVNNTINSYSWSAPGSIASTGTTTATPTFTYNAAGQYRVSCTIGTTDATSFTAHRFVFIVTESSPAPLLIREFNLDSFTGDYTSGGWTAQITLSGQADLTTIRDRSLAILHTRDWYGPRNSDEGSLGVVADRENIALIGYISMEGDLMGRLDSYSTTTFTIQGPAFWVNKPTGFPITVKDKNIPVTKWTRFFGATLRAATWHIWMWRTTGPRMMDVYPFTEPGGGWRAARFDAPGGQGVWEQLKTIMKNGLIGAPSADRYGRVFQQREQNTLDSATRASIPTVMTVTRADWYGSVNFERRQVDDVGFVNFSGVSWNGSAPTPLFALAPGHVPGRFGAPTQPEHLILYPDQTIVNTFAGAYWGWRNNPYPRLPINLAQNNPLIDIAPYQYCLINFAASDTPRGFVDNRRIIPRVIRRVWNKAGGYFTTEIEVEAETPIRPAITGDTPATPPSIPTVPPPLPIVPPAPVPTPSGNAKEVWLLLYNGNDGSPQRVYLAQAGSLNTGGQPTWNVWPLDGVLGTALRNFPFGALGFNTIGIDSSGTMLVIQAQDRSVGGANSGTLMICTNLPAVRASPSTTTPTWSILTRDNNTTSIAGKLVGSIGTGSLNPFNVFNGKLYYSFKNNTDNVQAIGVYDGSNWTLINNRTTFYNTVGPVYFWNPDLIANPSYLRRMDTNAIVDTMTLPFGAQGPMDSSWSRENDSSYYWWYPKKNAGDNNSTLRLRSNGTDLIVTAITGSPSYPIGGAPAGPHVYTIYNSGQLYKAADGINFAAIGVPWADAWPRDGNRNGGGTIYIARRDFVSSGQEFFRAYNQDGSVQQALTGDFYTKFPFNYGGLGMCLVYG